MPSTEPSAPAPHHPALRAGAGGAGLRRAGPRGAAVPAGGRRYPPPAGYRRAALIPPYLSADETARLHEQSAGILLALFERDSFWTRSWTVLRALAALAFAAVYARFLLRLEPRQRLLFFGSGALFVFGAVGMEVLGHYVVRRRFPTVDYGVVPYQAMVHLEEVMEKLAIVLLIYAALRELQRLAGTLRLRLSPEASITDAQPSS